VIDEKATQLPVYRQAAQEIRLLIHCDRTQPSQLFEIADDFDPKSIITPFDRTFLYRYPVGIALELGISK
jgi:hypothetical protein